MLNFLKRKFHQNVVEVHDILIDYIDRILVSTDIITFSTIKRSGRTGLCTTGQSSSIQELRQKDLQYTDLVIIGEKPCILFYKIILRNLHFDRTFILNKDGKEEINFEEYYKDAILSFLECFK